MIVEFKMGVLEKMGFALFLFGTVTAAASLLGAASFLYYPVFLIGIHMMVLGTILFVLSI